MQLLKGFFFNAVENPSYETGYDRNYDADDHSFVQRCFYKNGVLVRDGVDSLQVYYQGGLIRVRPGFAVVEGCLAASIGNETATPQTGTAVIRLDRTIEVRAFSFEIVQTLIQTVDVFDFPLADVTVDADGKVTVTDVRERSRFTGVEYTTLEDVEKFIEKINEVLDDLAGFAPKELALTILESGVFRPADYGLLGKAVDIYMVAGGGGGGGLSRGGGGGGHCILIRNFVLTEESYPVVIGAGGIGGTSVAAGAAGAVGGNTIAFGETVAGGLGAAGMAGGRGGSGGGASPGGNGGERGSGGGGGGVNANTEGAAGAGNIEFCPTNPYDGICYGSGGGGGCGRGGGSGGPIFANGIASRNGSLGGGGAGGTSVSGGMLGGQGGLGGGGGGGSHHQTSGAGGAGGRGLIYIYAVPQIEVGG